MPSAFGRDDYAGVQDYSHAGGFRTSRFLMTSAVSAAKSGSRTGTSPASSSCALASRLRENSARREINHRL